jgi:hypothetical protein
VIVKTSSGSLSRISSDGPSGFKEPISLFPKEQRDQLQSLKKLFYVGKKHFGDVGHLFHVGFKKEIDEPLTLAEMTEAIRFKKLTNEFPLDDQRKVFAYCDEKSTGEIEAGVLWRKLDEYDNISNDMKTRAERYKAREFLLDRYDQHTIAEELEHVKEKEVNPQFSRTISVSQSVCESQGSRSPFSKLVDVEEVLPPENDIMVEDQTKAFSPLRSVPQPQMVQSLGNMDMEHVPFYKMRASTLNLYERRAKAIHEEFNETMDRHSVVTNLSPQTYEEFLVDKKVKLLKEKAKRDAADVSDGLADNDLSTTGVSVLTNPTAFVLDSENNAGAKAQALHSTAVGASSGTPTGSGVRTGGVLPEHVSASPKSIPPLSPPAAEICSPTTRAERTPKSPAVTSNRSSPAHGARLPPMDPVITPNCSAGVDFESNAIPVTHAHKLKKSPIRTQSRQESGNGNSSGSGSGAKQSRKVAAVASHDYEEAVDFFPRSRSFVSMHSSENMRDCMTINQGADAMSLSPSSASGFCDDLGGASVHSSLSGDTFDVSSVDLSSVLPISAVDRKETHGKRYIPPKPNNLSTKSLSVLYGPADQSPYATTNDKYYTPFVRKPMQNFTRTMVGDAEIEARKREERRMHWNLRAEYQLQMAAHVKEVQQLDKQLQENQRTKNKNAAMIRFNTSVFLSDLNNFQKQPLQKPSRKIDMRHYAKNISGQLTDYNSSDDRDFKSIHNVDFTKHVVNRPAPEEVLAKPLKPEKRQDVFF